MQRQALVKRTNGRSEVVPGRIDQARGGVLQRSRFGDVDQAIGKTITSRSVWLIASNRI